MSTTRPRSVVPSARCWSLLDALPEPVRATAWRAAGARCSAAVAELGIPVTTIAGTAGSLRLHPLHTPRTLAEMSVAALQVRRAARAHRAELVHANSIRARHRARPGATLGRAAVVHVRDCLPPGPLTTATMRLIAATATTVVANSHYTAGSVRAGAPSARVEVVHNPVDLARWDPGADRPRGARARWARAGERELLLGVVAQLTPVEGTGHGRSRRSRCSVEDGVDAHLLLIGSAKFVARSTRFDNEAYVARLRARVAAGGSAGARRRSWASARTFPSSCARWTSCCFLPRRSRSGER